MSRLSRAHLIQLLWPPVACTGLLLASDWVASFRSAMVGWAFVLSSIYIVFAPALYFAFRPLPGATDAASCPKCAESAMAFAVARAAVPAGWRAAAEQDLTREALERGLDLARLHAAAVRVTLKRQWPDRHAAAHADVALIERALAAESKKNLTGAQAPRREE